MHVFWWCHWRVPAAPDSGSASFRRNCRWEAVQLSCCVFWVLKVFMQTLVGAYYLGCLAQAALMCTLLQVDRKFHSSRSWGYSALSHWEPGSHFEWGQNKCDSAPELYDKESSSDPHSVKSLLVHSSYFRCEYRYHNNSMLKEERTPLWSKHISLTRNNSGYSQSKGTKGKWKNWTEILVENGYLQ